MDGEEKAKTLSGRKKEYSQEPMLPHACKSREKRG
jgi:hypothetical protein